MNAILKDLSQLGPYERLQLVEDLWDSIDQDTLPAMTDTTRSLIPGAVDIAAAVLIIHVSPLVLFSNPILHL